MKIDRRLNLVVPIYGTPVQKNGPDGKPIFEDGRAVMDTPIEAWVHSQPLSAEAIDRDFLLLGQTFNSIFTDGLGAAAGPGHSLRLLRALAERQGIWTNKDKTPGQGMLLVEEIRRLTNVLVPGERGVWESIPLEVAVQSGRLSEDDRGEVENAIVFFICVSGTLLRNEREKMLSSFAALWDAQLSSSSATEWAASLRTSMPAGHSGARHPAPAGGKTAADARVDGKPVSVPR